MMTCLSVVISYKVIEVCRKVLQALCIVVAILKKYRKCIKYVFKLHEFAEESRKDFK
jgi:hypothetical protein